MSDIIWEMSDGDEFTTLEILEGRDLNREMEEHAAMIDARIAALEAKNARLEAEIAALRRRLEFTSCQKADVEAQVLALEEQNAALRKVVQTLRSAIAPYWPIASFDLSPQEILTLKAALAAAGLMEEEGK